MFCLVFAPSNKHRYHFSSSTRTHTHTKECLWELVCRTLKSTPRARSSWIDSFVCEKTSKFHIRIISLNEYYTWINHLVASLLKTIDRLVFVRIHDRPVRYHSIVPIKYILLPKNMISLILTRKTVHNCSCTYTSIFQLLTIIHVNCFLIYFRPRIF